MEVYPKINAPFKRGDDHKLIIGDWSVPEFGYLAGNEWEFTEKVDGTNIRIGLTRSKALRDIKFDIRGRGDNAVIPEPLLTALYGMIYNQYGMSHGHWLRWMDDNDLKNDVTLFGEGYGPNIQGGGKYRKDHSFVLFDVKIGPWWLSRDNVNDIAKKLGIDSVPVIGRGTLNDAMHLVSGWSYDDAATGEKIEVPSLRSTWGDFEAEGIVARPVVPLFDRKGHRITTKIKAKDFR